MWCSFYFFILFRIWNYLFFRLCSLTHIFYLNHTRLPLIVIWNEIIVRKCVVIREQLCLYLKVTLSNFKDNCWLNLVFPAIFYNNFAGILWVEIQCFLWKINIVLYLLPPIRDICVEYWIRLFSSLYWQKNSSPLIVWLDNALRNIDPYFTVYWWCKNEH